MASRGGGRGGGRGRGGPPNLGPIARDDDGTIIPTITGPPPLFPPIKQLPPLFELDIKDKLLLNRRRDLLSAWKWSPYFLDRKSSTRQEVEKFPVEKYTDPVSAKPKRQRAPLSTVLTLIPEYFPEELYSAQEKRSRGSSGAAHSSFWKNQANRDGSGLSRLDQLAAQEQRLKELEADGKEVKKPDDDEEGGAKKGEGDDVEGMEEEDDDDDYDDGDDYMQGEQYDDDEGYDDDLDGGDEGATY